MASQNESGGTNESPKKLDQQEHEFWHKQLPLGFQSHMEHIARVVMRNQPNDLYGFLARHTEEQLVKRNAELWSLPHEPYFEKLFRKKVRHTPSWNPIRRSALGLNLSAGIYPPVKDLEPDFIAIELIPETVMISKATDLAMTRICPDQGVDSPREKCSTQEEDLGSQHETSAFQESLEETPENPTRAAAMVESGTKPPNMADSTCSDGHENSQAFPPNKLGTRGNMAHAQSMMGEIETGVGRDESQSFSGSDWGVSSGQPKSEDSRSDQVSSGALYLDATGTHDSTTPTSSPTDIQPLAERCRSPINLLGRPEVMGNSVVSSAMADTAYGESNAPHQNHGKSKENQGDKVTEQFSPVFGPWWGEESQMEATPLGPEDKKATGMWKQAVKDLLKQEPEGENANPDTLPVAGFQAEEVGLHETALGEVEISPESNSDGEMSNEGSALEDEEAYDSVPSKEKEDVVKGFSGQQNADQSKSESEDFIACCDLEHSSSVDWVLCSSLSQAGVPRGVNRTRTEGCDSHMVKIGSEYLFPFFSCESGKLVFCGSSVDGNGRLGDWADDEKGHGEDSILSDYGENAPDGSMERENQTVAVGNDSANIEIISQADGLESDVSSQDPHNEKAAADWKDLERRKGDQIINSSERETSVHEDTDSPGISPGLDECVEGPKELQAVSDNSKLEGIGGNMTPSLPTEVSGVSGVGDTEELLKPDVLKEGDDSRIVSETADASEGAEILEETSRKPGCQSVFDPFSGKSRQIVQLEDENDKTKKEFEQKESQFTGSSTKPVFIEKLYQENETMNKEELSATVELEGSKKSTAMENSVCVGRDKDKDKDKDIPGGSLSNGTSDKDLVAGFYTPESRESGENRQLPETAFVIGNSDGGNVKEHESLPRELVDVSRRVEPMAPTHHDVLENNAEVTAGGIFEANTTEAESVPDGQRPTEMPVTDVTKKIAKLDLGGASGQDICLDTAKSDGDETLGNGMAQVECEREKSAKEVEREGDNQSPCLITSGAQSDATSPRNASGEIKMLVTEYISKLERVSSDVELILKSSQGRGHKSKTTTVEAACDSPKESCVDSKSGIEAEVALAEAEVAAAANDDPIRLTASEAEDVLHEIVRKFAGGGNCQESEEENFEFQFLSREKWVVVEITRTDGGCLFYVESKRREPNNCAHPSTDENNNGLHQSRPRSSAGAQIIFKRNVLCNLHQPKGKGTYGSPQSGSCVTQSREKSAVRRISISNPHYDAHLRQSQRQRKNSGDMKSNSPVSGDEKPTRHFSTTAYGSASAAGDSERHGRSAGGARRSSPPFSFTRKRPLITKGSTYSKEKFPPLTAVPDVIEGNYSNHFNAYSSNKYGASCHHHKKGEASSKKNEIDALVSNTDSLYDADFGVNLSQKHSQPLSQRTEKGSSPRENRINTPVNYKIRETDFPLRVLAYDTSKDGFVPEKSRCLSMEAPSDNTLIQTVITQTNSSPEEKEFELSSRKLRWYPDEKLDFVDTDESYRKLVLEYDCLAFREERGQQLNLENGTLWVSQTHFPEAGEMTSGSGDKGLFETLDATVPDELRSICGEIRKTVCANAKLRGNMLVIDKERGRSATTGAPGSPRMTDRDTLIEPGGSHLLGFGDTFDRVGWLRDKSRSKHHRQGNANTNYNPVSSPPKIGRSTLAQETDEWDKEKPSRQSRVKNSNNNAADYRCVHADSDDATLKEIEQITSETTTLGHVLRQPLSYENFFQGFAQPDTKGQSNADRREQQCSNGILKGKKAPPARVCRKTISISRYDYTDEDDSGSSENNSWRQLQSCMSPDTRPYEGGNGEKGETATQVKATDIGVVNVTQTGDSLQSMIPILPRRPSSRLKFLRPSSTPNLSVCEERLSDSVHHALKFTENGTQANQEEICASHDAQTGSSLMYDGPACKWIYKGSALRGDAHEELRETANGVGKDNVNGAWDRESQVVATDIQVDEGIQTGLSKREEKGAPQTIKPNKYRDLDDCQCQTGEEAEETERKGAKIHKPTNFTDRIDMGTVVASQMGFTVEENDFKRKEREDEDIGNYQPSRIRISRTSSQKSTNGSPRNASLTGVNRFDDSDGDTPKSLHEAGSKQSATTQVMPSEINVDGNAQTGSSLLQMPALIKQPSLNFAGRSIATDISDFETLPNPSSVTDTETYQVGTEVDKPPPELPEYVADDTQGDYNQWNCIYFYPGETSTHRNEAESDFGGTSISSRMGCVTDTSGNHVDSLARRKRRDSQGTGCDYVYTSQAVGDSFIDHVFPCDVAGTWNDVATNCRMKPQNNQIRSDPQSGQLFYDCVGAMKMMPSTPRFDDDSVYTYSANQGFARKTITKSAVDIGNPSKENKSAPLSRTNDEKASIRRYVERVAATRNSKSVGVTWASDVPMAGSRLRHEGCQTYGEVQMATNVSCCHRCRNGLNVKRAGTQTEITCCSQRDKLSRSTLEEVRNNKVSRQPIQIRPGRRSMSFWEKNESKLKCPLAGHRSLSEDDSWDAPENTNMSKDNSRSRPYKVTTMETPRKAAIKRQGVSSTSSDSMSSFVSRNKGCANQGLGRKKRKNKEGVGSAVANGQGDAELKLSENVRKVVDQNFFQSSENSRTSITFTKSTSACCTRPRAISPTTSEDYLTSITNEDETEGGLYGIHHEDDLMKDGAKRIPRDYCGTKKILPTGPQNHMEKDRGITPPARAFRKTDTTKVKCMPNALASNYANLKPLNYQHPQRAENVTEKKGRNETNGQASSCPYNHKSQAKRPKPKEVCLHKSILKKTPNTKIVSGHNAPTSVVAAGSSNSHRKSPTSVVAAGSSNSHRKPPTSVVAAGSSNSHRKPPTSVVAAGSSNSHRKSAAPKQAARAPLTSRADNVALSQRIGTGKCSSSSSRRSRSLTGSKENKPTVKERKAEPHVPYRKRRVCTNGPSTSVQSYLPQKPKVHTGYHSQLSPSTLSCLRQVYGPPAFAGYRGEA